MSKVAIVGDASGTGTLTIQAPNTNSNYTLTLPEETGTLVAATGGVLPALDGSNLTGISSYSDSDALTLFNASGAAPVYACRAWVNFNGTGTVAIRESGNVSSITDRGTGQYTVNLTTAMPDDEYSISAQQGTNVFFATTIKNSSSSFYIDVRDVRASESYTYRDNADVVAAVFR